MAASLEDLDENTVKELASLARELSDTPETRKEFLTLSKKVRPNMPVPELDLDERLLANRKESAEEIASLRAQLSERDMRAELDRRRQKLIDEGKASSMEDVMAIEKMMLDKKIGDHETAADYWKWMEQAAKPTPALYDKAFMNKSAQDTLASYWKNPKAAATAEAAAAFNDIRSGKVRLQ